MINDQVDSSKINVRDKQRMTYFIPNYLEKFIKKNDIICSAGCGTGYDVFLLNKMGYDAYGFDPSQRSEEWNSISSDIQSKLKKSFAYEFPFGKAKFDFVYALEVIEHVGCVDGIWQLMENSDELRAEFFENIIDMLKPNGTIILTVANRLFPFDSGHGHHYHWLPNFFNAKLNLRVTIPWHTKNFLLSFSDAKKLLKATKYSNKAKIDIVSTKNFLSFSNRSKNSFLWRSIKWIIAKYYDYSSSIPFIRASFLNPFLVIRICKKL